METKLNRICSLLFFYIIVTPIGLICRVIGKDVLDEEIDKSKSTYWHYRKNGEFDKDSLKHQY